MLKAEIVRNGLTHKEVAGRIGMSRKTFSNRMNKGYFGLDEAQKLIEVLGIEAEKAHQIFLPKK